MWPFRILGIAVVAFSGMCLALVAANRFAAASGGHDLTPGAVPALVLMIVGVGLYGRLRFS
jgi:hypothetical protein